LEAIEKDQILANLLAINSLNSHINTNQASLRFLSIIIYAYYYSVVVSLLF